MRMSDLVIFMLSMLYCSSQKFINIIDKID